MGTGAEPCRIHYEQPGAASRLADALCRVLQSARLPGQPLVFLCIGTDRSTGDCLGPLVGRSLAAWVASWVHVVGSLDDPVHASNLEEAMTQVEQTWPEASVVAVDACLGRLETVGTITVGAGPLCPGAGVNKTLPQVGGAYVTGTVNVGGFMEYFVLQNTRLSLVVRMADVVAEGLATAALRMQVGPATATVAATQMVVASGAGPRST